MTGIRQLTVREFRERIERGRGPAAATPDAPPDLAGEAARAILGEVAARGDGALVEYAARWDNVRLPAERLRVAPEEMRATAKLCPPEVWSALRLALDNLWDYHCRQVPAPTAGWDTSNARIAGLSRRRVLRPVGSVGLYVPGGTACYPSTVLMTAVPARLAGVGRIAICTPPGPYGTPSPPVMAAAQLCGIDEVYRVGGAQAVAALALGTATIPRVALIAGPGNVYVAAAKRLVQGFVGIDLPAGPSELLVVADDTADPDLIAVDLLAQAEHDVRAECVLITPAPDLPARVVARLNRRLSRAPRRDIAARALEDRGAVVCTADLDEAMELANAYAPEHLSLMVGEPARLLDRVTDAGMVLLGPWASPVLSDYTAGTNHVLPTGGAARFTGGLGVESFLRPISVLWADRRGVAAIGPAAALLARTEGLHAHAEAADARLNLRLPATPADDGLAGVGSGPAAVTRPDQALAGYAGDPDPSESEARIMLAARETFTRAGYVEVNLPVAAPIEDFKLDDLAADWATLADRTVKFVDPAGRVMALRPDWTLAVARWAATRLARPAWPPVSPACGGDIVPSESLRVSYAGPVFRLPVRRAVGWGSVYEWNQVGVELIGPDTVEADAEILGLAVRFLKILGLEGFRLCIGHVCMLQGLIGTLGASPDMAQDMSRALAARDLVAWEELLGSTLVDDTAADRVRRIVDSRWPAPFPDNLRHPADLGPAVAVPLERLTALAEMIGVQGHSQSVVVDPGLVSDLGYYTGLVFEAYAPGCARPILTGGRYDSLVGAFGVERPAVGMAADVATLANSLVTARWRCQG